MGDLLGNILGGGGQAPVQGGAGLLDFLSAGQPQIAGPGGFAGPMQGGIPETGAIPGADQGLEEAVVRGFKPKKRSIWGVIGDAILLNAGHKGPYFADRVRDKNFSRAMEGFTQEPLEAIRRVSQIPGMADEAFKMYGQYRDDSRGDQTQQRLMGKDRESLIMKANRLLGTVKEDGSNYGLVRQMYNSIMERNQIDSQLPEEFDPDYVAAIYGGEMTPNQREMMEFRKGREQRQAEDTDRRLDITERNVDSQISSRATRDRVAVRNVTAREAAAAAKSKTGSAPGATGARKVKTKYGEGEVDPAGKYLRVKGPDGSTYIYRSTGPDKWTLFKKAD